MAEYAIKQLDRKNEKHHAAWKRLLASARGATIFHDPDFLAYHGDRFNEHHLGIHKGEQLCGIMPMALVQQDGRTVAKSPYGASYGGPVFDFTPNYADSKCIVAGLIGHAQEAGAQEITVTPPINAYYRAPDATFVFAMLEQGFRCINSDITSVVALGADLEKEVFSSRPRRMYAKAQKAGLRMAEKADLDLFWGLMNKTFDKHGSKPTHTLEEFKSLQAAFPDNIWADVAMLDGTPVAGVGHFRLNNLADMSFYICSDPEFQGLQGVTFAIYSGILASAKAGMKCYDLGTSSVGMKARENIFTFKEGFGAAGVFRHSYKLALDSEPAA